jgi:flagellar biosynthesis/type III secretory pathway protein FliH
MTIQSLQKIIRLERELYAAEQAEQEKAFLWLKEQETEILRQHEKRLAALEEKISEAKAQATEDATAKASSLIREAQARAECMDGVEESGLRRLVEKSLRYIVGQTV